MTDQIKDGGPAFPHDDRAQHFERTGMTMRDYFAAKAMAAMSNGSWADSITRPEIAKRAYLMADAMLAAREAQS